MIRSPGLGTAAALATLVACAPTPTQPPLAEVTGPPPDFPEASYRQARRQGRSVYHIEPEESRITVRVHRGGKLARFGHDHLVTATGVQGFVVAPRRDQAGRGDLFLPVTALQVDPPEAVRETGFGAELAPADRRATRANMLREVLEAQRFPYIRMEVGPFSQMPPASPVDVSLTLHGVTRERQVRVRTERSGEAWTITGKLSLRHRAFDMEPYSAMGGALRVKDRLDLSFRFRASRSGAPTRASRSRSIEVPGRREPGMVQPPWERR